MAFLSQGYVSSNTVTVEFEESGEHVARLVITPTHEACYRGIGVTTVLLTAADLADLREALVPERDPQDDHLPTAQDEADWMDMLMS